MITAVIPLYILCLLRLDAACLLLAWSEYIIHVSQMLV